MSPQLFPIFDTRKGNCHICMCIGNLKVDQYMTAYMTVNAEKRCHAVDPHVLLYSVCMPNHRSFSFHCGHGSICMYMVQHTPISSNCHPCAFLSPERVPPGCAEVVTADCTSCWRNWRSHRHCSCCLLCETQDGMLDVQWPRTRHVADV